MHPGYPAEGLGVNFPPLGLLDTAPAQGERFFSLAVLCTHCKAFHSEKFICTKVCLYRVQTVQLYWVTA